VKTAAAALKMHENLLLQASFDFSTGQSPYQYHQAQVDQCPFQKNGSTSDRASEASKAWTLNN
jgi:hypothetical protein